MNSENLRNNNLQLSYDCKISTPYHWSSRNASRVEDSGEWMKVQDCVGSPRHACHHGQCRLAGITLQKQGTSLARPGAGNQWMFLYKILEYVTNIIMGEK